MEKVRLGDIVDTIQGSQYPVDEQIYIRKEGYERFLRISDYTKINEPERFVKYTGKELICTEEDVVVVRYGNIGSIGIGKAGILANNLFALKKKGNKDIISKYIYYFLRSKKINNVLVNKANSSTMPALTHKMIKELEIPIYTKELEIKIVKELDKVQEIIDLRKKQIEQLDKLSKSQFVELFGNISEYERLENYAVLITKGASPKWQGINYQNDGTLFVTSENVREGFVDISKPKYLDNKINEILPRSILKRDDILINIVGASIGRAAKYDYDYLANINQAVALVRTQNINNIFLLTYLNSDEAIKMYDDMKKGGARENLSLKNIADLRIPKASMELQNQFADIVKQIDKQKFILEKSLKKLEEMQESLMNKYFE